MCKSLAIYLDILNGKLKLFQDILTLTLFQYDLIEKEDYKALDKNLKQRNMLILEIDPVNKRQKDMELEEYSLDEMKKINLIKQQIVEIREKIVYHNVILKDNLTEKKEECRNELRNISINRKASRVYNNWDYKRPSSFFDKKN
jgi:hypothetical protein